ncbi:unnamed protein product, partial [Nesidiocoris tenuis]
MQNDCLLNNLLKYPARFALQRSRFERGDPHQRREQEIDRSRRIQKSLLLHSAARCRPTASPSIGSDEPSDAFETRLQRQRQGETSK